MLVLQLLLDLFYYLTLFLIPFSIYSIFFKREIVKIKDWFYLIKFYIAKLAVDKYQLKYKNSLKKTPLEQIENPKEIISDKESDSLFIYGVDQKGHSFTLKIILRSGLLAEIYINLKLASGPIYQLASSDGALELYSLTDWQWRTKNLLIDILEPFKRMRICFNGLLRNGDAILEHIQFNFIWTAHASPQFYPQSVSAGALAEALAFEKWRDGDWLKYLGDQRGYEQFGTIRGTIKATDEFIVNLTSVKSRFWGTKDQITFNKYCHLFIATKTGILASLWARNLKNGCTDLKFGHVVVKEGHVCPVDKNNFELVQYSVNRALPTFYKLEFRAGNTDFCTVLFGSKQKRNGVCNNEMQGYQLKVLHGDSTVNTEKGKAIIEFYFSQVGNGAVTLPPPLLKQLRTERLPGNLVIGFAEEYAQIVALTGGKGSSLATLTSIKSSKFIVPDGFVVTVNCYDQQLLKQPEIKKAVSDLSAIFCGRKTGRSLEDACAKVCDEIKTIELCHEIKMAVIQYLDDLKSRHPISAPLRLAVRSSGVIEDSDDVSCAGQNQTFLGLTANPDDVMKAIVSCWASLYTYQSVKYRHQHGLAIDTQMAVVVQTMVAAECAGVLFTCHPTTVNPEEMAITANYGLGESVVSGIIDADTIILEKTQNDDGRQTVKIKSKSPGSKHSVIKMAADSATTEELSNSFSGDTCCLNDKQIMLLGDIGLYLEDLYGTPRDLEWAFDSRNQLFLVQSRPVTTLNQWTDFELVHEFDTACLSETNTVYTVANAAEVFPGVQSTLCLTLTVPAIDGALQQNVAVKRETNALRCLATFDNHVFIDVLNSMYHNPTKSINLSSKILDLTVFGHPVIDERLHQVSIDRWGIRSPLYLLRITLRMVYNALRCQRQISNVKQLAANLNFAIENGDSPSAIYEKIDQNLNVLSQVLRYHVLVSGISVFYQVLAMNVLAEKNSDLNMDHYNDIALLLSSCEDVVSAEVPQILSEIAAILTRHNKFTEFCNIDAENGINWLEQNCPDAATVLQTFFEEHGHRVVGEFDPLKETWAQNPRLVIKMIQANTLNTKIEKKQRPLEEIIGSLVSPSSDITRKLLKFLMGKSRKVVGARENSKSESIRAVNKYRYAYIQLGHEMALHGLLPSSSLIFHLSHYEIGQLIQNDGKSVQIIAKAVRRRRLYHQLDKLKFPELSYGIPQPEIDDFLATVGSGSSDIKCTGTPVYQGTIQARACVITSLNDIDQLQNGDILITYSTDIGWSPYFPMLAGIVTELGGLVSHGAVIAREYGLPSVVGVRGVTKIFKTGDIVLLSGKSGVVELIRRD